MSGTACASLDSASMSRQATTMDADVLRVRITSPPRRCRCEPERRNNGWDPRAVTRSRPPSPPVARDVPERFVGFARSSSDGTAPGPALAYRQQTFVFVLQSYCPSLSSLVRKYLSVFGKPFVEADAGLPAEERARAGDVGLAHLRIVLGKRPVHDPALRASQLDDLPGDLLDRHLLRVADVDGIVLVGFIRRMIPSTRSLT